MQALHGTEIRLAIMKEVLSGLAGLDLDQNGPFHLCSPSINDATERSVPVLVSMNSCGFKNINWIVNEY